MIWSKLINFKQKRLQKKNQKNPQIIYQKQIALYQKFLANKKVKTNFSQYQYLLVMTKISKLKEQLQQLKLSSKWRFWRYKIVLKKFNANLNRKLYWEAKSKIIKSQKEQEMLAAFIKARNHKIIKYSLKSLIYAFLIFYALITLYPFIWAIAGSFRPQSEFANAGLNPFPNTWTLEAYNYLFTNPNSYFNAWIWNSIWTSVVGVIINLFLNTMAGYALARFNFKGRNQIFWIIISLSMVPAQVLMIPNFLIVKNFNLYNNLWALIIPSAVNIGYIFMSRQFFLNFPKEIEEAASIDGMNKLKVLWKIVVPLMRPLIITQAIFLFMGFWNNFLNARIYINNEAKFTLTVGIQNLIDANIYNIEYGQILAASTFSIIPVLVIYATLNGAILKGRQSDGDK